MSKMPQLEQLSSSFPSFLPILTEYITKTVGFEVRTVDSPIIYGEGIDFKDCHSYDGNKPYTWIKYDMCPALRRQAQ